MRQSLNTVRNEGPNAYQEARTAKLRTLEALQKEKGALEVTLRAFAENDPEVIEHMGTRKKRVHTTHE